MSNQENKTKFANPQTADRRWVLIDAKGKKLGRLACEVARILTGKRKANYSAHADVGDFVIVTNTDQLLYSGKNKGQQKIYWHHSGHPSGLHTETLEDFFARDSAKLFWKVVWGMLPKSTARRQALGKKLKVYKGDTHPHAAQTPTDISERVRA